jgi:hypothetical protein
LRSTVSVSKPGLSVGENGEVIKVPAFLNKLFRCVNERRPHSHARARANTQYGVRTRDRQLDILGRVRRLVLW